MSRLPKQRRPRVIVLFGGLGDLSGGGGAERYFADVLTRYIALPDRRLDLTLVSDPSSLRRLEQVGRRLPGEALLLLPDTSRLLGNMTYLRALWQQIVVAQADLVYVPLVNPRYLALLTALRFQRSRSSPRIAINVLDCTIAHQLTDHLPLPGRRSRMYWLYLAYFKLVRPDGLFTPYRAFRETYPGWSRRSGVVAGIDSFLVDTKLFAPAATKENMVVWAGRLDRQKQPLLYVDALLELRRRSPEAFAGWQFRLFGKGHLEGEIRSRITNSGLSRNVQLSSTPRMHEVLASAKVYVSTQDHENYSSLAMLEAMAAGNAIIARPVGETSRWVRSGLNGELSEDNSAEALARAIADVISDSGKVVAFGAQSRRLAEEIGHIPKTMGELENFLCSVMKL